MPQFEFHLDRKVTQWYRETHFVDAETLQEAQSKMINLFLEDDTEETFDYQDALNDTWEDITPEQNNDNPTAELWCEESGLLLIDNVVKEPMI